MVNQKKERSALIIIGNEILSGRTLDKNTQSIAEKMSEHGVPLSEVRIVPDIEVEIIAAVNALRAKYDYVFTTGGIGPTHDDITAACIAKAFEAEFGTHAQAYDILLDFYGEENLTQARATMAKMPIYDDMELIRNPVSAAPGFRIENVFVMAGVPKIMNAMLDHVVEMITPGEPLHSRTLMISAPESEIAAILSALQDSYPNIDIGSYPQYKDGHWGVSAVLRGVDIPMLEAAREVLAKKLVAIGIDVQSVKV
mgnify:CR=1 FL=1